MTGQQTLFAPAAGRARVTDPQTSREAAQLDRSALTHRILDAFQTHGPMTDDELSALLVDVHPPTLKSCRSRIAILEPTGRTRPSNRGKPMSIWTLPAQCRRIETVNDPQGRVA